MTDFWQRLQQRKLVQWAMAYLAAAWVLLQVLDLAADSYEWPTLIMRIAFGLIALGFLVTLVLAWYHGERGVQKVSATELLIVALLLLVGGGLIWQFSQSSPTSDTTQVSASGQVSVSPAAGATGADTPAVADKSVAVLAFSNMSDDKQNEYFSDGVSEELLNVLARVPGLKVTARTSSFFFKGQNVPIPEIGERLGVAYVVEGSVRKAGNKVRITAQLIKASEGFHVWSETYDRELDDIFALQEELASSIAKELSGAIGISQTSVAATGTTRSVPAYEKYLKGRQAWNLTTHAGDLEAVEYFKSALALDPDYAMAHGALAEAYVSLANDGVEPASKVFPLARASAKRALAIDPDNVQAHTALAEYAFHYDWDWAASDRHIEQALAADPNYAMAYSRHAGHLSARNLLEDGAAADQRARELDPVNQNSLRSSNLLYRRHYAEAIEAANGELADNSSSNVARTNLGQALALSGKPDEAVEMFRAMAIETPEDLRVQANLGWALGLSGQAELAGAILRQLTTLADTHFVSPLSLAMVALGIGDHDRVFVELEKAREVRDPMLPFIGYAPFWDPVRGDPRFRELLRQLNLDEYFPETADLTSMKPGDTDG
ncbi:tetratricopeptide repeat protein [Dokdonella sp.]|uniref:tetratricopeptide repeat protein n=1 Tax=Dokdonella sp. TaxID=2291710 RepID=UPI003C66FC88